MSFLFYSWKDVERHCFINRDIWSGVFSSIEVYPEEMVLHRKSEVIADEEKYLKILNDLFHDKYSPSENSVVLDLNHSKIAIIVEDEEPYASQAPLRPLFRSVLYHKSAYPSEKLNSLTKPVIAFHSYKGGVGRTLSLAAFAKAWASTFAKSGKSGLLIVDADIEAPGLTWIQEDGVSGFEAYPGGSSETFSYLDLLTLIQDSRDSMQTIELACSKIRLSTLRIETETQAVEHIFMPVYRYPEQLLDLYANPESIVNQKGKDYMLAEVLSGICEKLNLEAVLVDLRAGISEFSSTLLFDPRVKKYLVTSTSSQSVMGLQTILEYVTKGLEIGENSVVPEILMNMVPAALSESEKSSLTETLFEYYERAGISAEATMNQVIKEFAFDPELVHLTSLQQIFSLLDGRGFYLKMKELVEESYDASVGEPLTQLDRKTILEQINKLANAQLSAESGANMDVLMTQSLQRLKQRFSETIPCTVIMGAKGSGKTFLYQKMASCGDWKTFCKEIYGLPVSQMDGFFIPVIATSNLGNIHRIFSRCVEDANSSVACLKVKSSIFLDNVAELKKAIESENISWLDRWEQLLAASLNPSFNNLDTANQALQECGKKVVFLVDGLEEIFRDTFSEKMQQDAIRELCQDIVNQLTVRYANIGIAIFLRRDLARAAIQINYSQFEQVYQDVALKWSSSEALRLAVWLVSQADKSFYTQNDVKIENASQAVIKEHLIKLWGLKLGKPTSNEANSSNWILAALSDFNGQLQARDIIRFLAHATESENPSAPYDDRIIMPVEIRSAIQSCSQEKLASVREEYHSLLSAFDKFANLDERRKTLPLSPDEVHLSQPEEKNMIDEGFLLRIRDEKTDEDQYFVPEIIRNALGLRYSRGARPKVLSLMKKTKAK